MQMQAINNPDTCRKKSLRYYFTTSGVLLNTGCTRPAVYARAPAGSRKMDP